MVHICELPVEAFVEILSKTNGITLGRCRRVCKKWKECIDEIDYLWHRVCKREFKCSSSIAKKKSASDCNWYNIYKNLSMWSTISSTEKNLREFYNFQLHDKGHALPIDSGILPLRDTRGVVLYDMNTLKYVPVVVPEKNCIKIANNSNVTTVLLKSGLFIQRTVESLNKMAEAFFEADNFVLVDDMVYFCRNRDVFRCDIIADNLASKLVLHCDYDIKEIQYHANVLHIFTDCGKVVSIDKARNMSVKSISIPVEWIKQIKHISAIDDKNFVCYSRNLFKIETDQYQHLYLDFPPITALFFYGDVVLIGTRSGEILLYRLSSQKRATKPIFEKLAVLPDGKYAVQLDVCERKSGPVIIAATFFEIMIMEVTFFTHDLGNGSKKTFTTDKVNMYKRLLNLKIRLQMY